MRITFALPTFLFALAMVDFESLSAANALLAFDGPNAPNNRGIPCFGQTGVRNLTLLTVAQRQNDAPPRATETVVAEILGPGGTAQIFADGHSAWKSNDQH